MKYQVLGAVILASFLVIFYYHFRVLEGFCFGNGDWAFYKHYMAHNGELSEGKQTIYESKCFRGYDTI